MVFHTIPLFYKGIQVDFIPLIHQHGAVDILRLLLVTQGFDEEPLSADGLIYVDSQRIVQNRDTSSTPRKRQKARANPLKNILLTNNSE